MKKYLLLFALLLTVIAQAKDKMIDRPAFKSSSSDLVPVKVELTKKATIVHFFARCAHWRTWTMTGARLECNGQTYACQNSRILTHDGKTILTDEPLEFGKDYEQNAQQDSIILSFDPLPKQAKTFDYIEGDGYNSWKALGIRLDGELYPLVLPPYLEPTDDGQPLQPLVPSYGKITTKVTKHEVGELAYFGEPANDPITGEFKSESQFDDSLFTFCHPAYLPRKIAWVGPRIDPSAIASQFVLLNIPGETLTLEIDGNACTALQFGFGNGRVDRHDCYRLGGTLADLNQVALENQMLFYSQIEEVPELVDGDNFPTWCERLWQSIDTLRQGIMKRPGYTRRQRDYANLMADACYLGIRHDYERALRYKMRSSGLNMDSLLTRLKATFTLEDPHARDLQLFRDGRTYYATTSTGLLPYLRANGLDSGEVYEFLSAFDEAIALGQKMKNAEVQSDSAFVGIHPYFQPVLRAFNDSTRVLVERLKREAADRIMPTPDVAGDQLIQTIANQYPGKAVFFDLWATWCGPCKSGIAAMEPLKEQQRDKDVVFVYLTNESSPLNEWNDYVLKIPGQHYRIPSSLWEQIPNVSAIPQYYLYDRQGKQVWQQTGFDNSVLKAIESEIENILK